MFVNHFVDPDLRVQVIFRKEGTEENGGIHFEIGDIGTSAHWYWMLKKIAFKSLFQGSHMSCISCILEKLRNCPVFSCIQLICPVLSCFFRYIAYQNKSCLFYSLKNVLLIEKKRLTICSRFYINVIALLSCFRRFDL